jgi:hypothetical protein
VTCSRSEIFCVRCKILIFTHFPLRKYRKPETFEPRSHLQCVWGTFVRNVQAQYRFHPVSLLRAFSVFIHERPNLPNCIYYCKKIVLFFFSFLFVSLSVSHYWEYGCRENNGTPNLHAFIRFGLLWVRNSVLVCVCLCMDKCASLAPERLDGFYSYSVFTKLIAIFRCPLNSPARKTGALHLNHKTQNGDCLENGI